MMLKRSIVGACALVLCCGFAATTGYAQEGEAVNARPYEDHKIVRLNVTDLEMLQDLEARAITLTCRPMLGDQPVVLHEDVLADLAAKGIPFVVIEDDAQAWVDQDRAQRQARRAQRGVGFYEIYRGYQEISDHLDGLVAANPGVAERISIGTSLGDEPLGLPGLDIYAIKVTGPSMPGAPEKPIVVINGCQHAREWISPTATTFVCETFITQYGVDPRITDILDTVEVHFIPIVNPNGYEYTRNVERFWRKNRRTNTGAQSGTAGVDPNRNWPVGWGNNVGNDNNGSSETYRGTAELSEPETALVATYLESLAGTVECLDGCGSDCCPIGERTSRLKGHIDVHSFSQVILGPWSFTTAVAPPRAEELTLVQDLMSDAMSSAAGAPYAAALGDMPLLGAAGGVMPDWTFGELGTLSWTIEMRPQGGGLAGFDLPESQIDEASAELLAAVLELTEHAGKRLGIVQEQSVPGLVQAGSTLDLSVDIVEFNGFDLTPGSAVLRSRIGTSGMFGATALSFDGTSYNASVTAPDCGETLQYYFEAMADDGTVVALPADAEATVFETVGAELLAAFDDDFETDQGWNVNLLGSDTATTGQWERANPAPTGGAQPADDFSADGTLCFVTGAAGGTLGAADIDGGATSLTSPIFDLSDASGATVRYTRWYSNNLGGAPNADTFVIEISDNNGGTWTNLETIGPGGPEAGGGWNTVEFNVADFVGLTDSVRVRFTASDFGAGSVVEALVDEFMIDVNNECPNVNTCIADFDGDGDVDLGDFGIFGAAFNSVPADSNWDPRADFDGDNDVDLGDFGLFGGEFNRVDCLP